MSRHEGVSCDSCMKNNFRGRRYKCLICYDYDLCASCFEEGATSTRHLVEHPMQCILTRSDFDLFYAGETCSTDQPQSFTCPYCKKMGFSDATLIDHVNAEHIDTGLEVVCPICAALPGGDPNLITDDLSYHLNLEHRAPARGDLISFLDEPSSIRHGGVRRIPHTGSGGRALGGPRSRRSNMHFSSAGTLSALSPAGRDSVDPISELLSQLTGVRRGAPQPSQLQQLQMQIQLERQQVTAARQNLERLPRRQAHSLANASNASVIGSGGAATMAQVVNGAAVSILGGSAAPGQQAVLSSNGVDRDLSASSNPLPIGGPTGSGAASTANSSTSVANISQTTFLLRRFAAPVPEAERVETESNRADRSLYVQSLLLSTMASLQIPDHDSASDAADSAAATAEQTTAVDGEHDDQQPMPAVDCDDAASLENQPPQHPQQFDYGRNSGSLLSAKMKNATGGGSVAGIVKPPPPSGAARAPVVGAPRTQQKTQRELKANAVPAKESSSHDSTR